MPNRNRGAGFKTVTFLFFSIILALIVIAAFSLGWKDGKTVGEYEANSDTYARYAEEQISDCFTLTEDAAKSVCIRGVIEATNENERAEADLVAQTEMGLWAFAMLIVSALMLAVTALGVWWVRDTLVETRRAVRAADDAVTVTREVGQAQMRAYLSVDISHISVSPVGHFRKYFNGLHTIRATIIARNCGGTPANNVSLGARFIPISENIPDSGFIGIAPQKSETSDNLGSIAPSQCSKITVSENCNLVGGEIFAKKQTILATGTLKYDTVSGCGETTYLLHFVNFNTFAKSIASGENNVTITTARARHGNEIR